MNKIEYKTKGLDKITKKLIQGFKKVNTTQTK